MSDIKITGNTEPVVGKQELYTINGVLGNVMQQNLLTPKKSDNPFENMTKWSVHVLENGKWRKTEGNDKTGETAPYTFNQKSLERKGIKLGVERGDEYASIIIIPQKAEVAQITKVEILDDQGKTPTKPFAYGQTLIARTHCVHMELRPVTVTLWEDDATGAGHNAINNKNKIQTKTNSVLKGIVDIPFLLTPDAAKIANAIKAKGDSSEGKTHEYYVTAEIYAKEPKKIASANVMANNPDYKAESTPPAKKPAPAEKKGKSKKEEKGIGETIIDGIHDWFEETVNISPIILPSPTDIINSVMKIFVPDVEKEDEKKNTSCGEKYCLKKGDKSELIREINIRLAGFGGNVPTDEFTDRTEKMVKQFQRDYMRVAETGKVCGNILKAVDDFQAKFPINFNEIKCSCGTCNGYGSERNSEEYQNSSIAEKHRKYEYPGIHRSLVSGYRAAIFYINKDKQLNYKTKKIESGYRCHDHPIYKSTKTTNHCGKALDIHYNILSTGERTRSTDDMNKIRKEIFNKYLGAKWDWKNGGDIFNLESSSIGAKTWVHVDVREFSQEYLTNKYFVKDLKELNGKNLVAFATELGHNKTCICNGGSTGSDAITLTNNTSQRVDPKTLKASDKLIQFIKDWEKLEKKPYNDSKEYCTIGYGHLIKKKKCEDILIPDEFKNGITEAEATKLFREDLKEFEKAVQRDVTVNLHQREFDALIDLLFNCGAYFLSTNKAPNLYKNLLDENYEDAAKEFLDIENQKRRKQNYEIFINGNYDSTH
jgi:GH24 family phage-related lysozyme (muramidase)